MLPDYNFQDVFQSNIKNMKLSLPGYKKNYLKLEYPGNDIPSSHDREEHGTLLPFAVSNVFYARLTAWRKLTSKNDSCKPVYEVAFDVKDSNFKFKAGDTIGVIPHNQHDEVCTIIKHLNLSSKVNLKYHLTVYSGQIGGKIPSHIPEKSTLMHVLTNCLDLRSIVKKLFLLALSQHTKDETEKRAMEYLSSKEGCAAYTTHILNKNISVLDIFSIFKSCKPPIEVLLANLPRLLPRPYSIVYSGQDNPNILKVCFSVMNIGNNRKGLTTSWLETLILNKDINLERRFEQLNIEDGESRVPIYLRKNNAGFCLPDRIEYPLILIGPGTGVAPFIGFLDERQLMLQKSKANVGYTWLFFGCKDPKTDFIYEKEINTHISNGTLNRLTLAISRAENNGVKYVQDAILQHGEEVSKLIERNAVIFICGDIRQMALQVRESIMKCLTQHSEKSSVEAEEIIKIMEREKRYNVDVWS